MAERDVGGREIREQLSLEVAGKTKRRLNIMAAALGKPKGVVLDEAVDSFFERNKSNVLDAEREA